MPYCEPPAVWQFCKPIACRIAVVAKVRSFFTYDVHFSNGEHKDGVPFTCLPYCARPHRSCHRLELSRSARGRGAAEGRPQGRPRSEEGVREGRRSREGSRPGSSPAVSGAAVDLRAGGAVGAELQTRR